MGSESEHISLGAIAESDAVKKTIEESTNQGTVGGTNKETGN